MFSYSDPIGLDFAGKLVVQEIYRRILDRWYDRTAIRAASAITWLEAFDGLEPNKIAPSRVGWKAFPVTSNATEQEIDEQRFAQQDEYVEWQVVRDNGVIKQIIFTTEFPEYYEAYAQSSHADLISAIQTAIPGAAPTPLELYGQASVPGNAEQRAASFTANLQNNPWNNGNKGILCLAQQFNTLGALFNLLVNCGINKSPSAVGDTCGLVGGFCGENRASDPTVCNAAQTAVRNAKCFSLADPAGIHIVGITDTLALNGEPANAMEDIWRVDRGGRRATLNVRPGLTLNGQDIVTGAQVSRELSVAADLLVTDQINLPEWARTGRESLGRGGN
jgi:hypothetical protein